MPWRDVQNTIAYVLAVPYYEDILSIKQGEV